MIIDVRIGGNRAQFASQTQHLSPESLVTLKKLFIGDETPDFYEGLLAGLAGVYQMLLSMPPDVVTRFTGESIAWIAAGKYKATE